MNTTAKDRLPKTFWWANFTQFGGAMNDNLFKLFMIYALLDWSGPENRANILALVGLAFAVPFLIFIPIAGSFADHYSKRSVIVVLKAAEFVVMSVGVLALWLQSGAMLYATIFLMSTQSAFFGPCKYGIIPEQVGARRLSRANGVIQMFTYLAILAGTVIAPALSEYFGDYHARAASVCLLVAAGGFLCSLKIEPTPDHRRRAINFNGFMNLFRTSRIIRRDGFLTLAVLAGSFFTLIGAFTQLNVLDYGAQHLGLSEEQSTRLFLLTAVGIGLGSVFAGWISGRSIEFGIVPVGTALMFASLVVIGTVPEGSILVVQMCMFLIGIGAGFYVVPLEAFIQYRSPKDKVGSVKAANGFLSWIGVVLASALLFVNSSLINLTAQQGFLVASALLFILAVFSFWVLPDFFVKFVIMCIVRCLYRLRVLGIDNLPADRAALLVCNHVSLMDALLVVSSQQRRIRVLMSRRVYNDANWMIRKIVTFSGVILIQDSDGPKQLVRSLKDARKALDDGFLVCIFAEGGLTLSGMMLPFKSGFERILKGSDHPIIPVYIGGVWGSVSSWKSGMPVMNPFRELRHRVSVHFGEAIPGSSSASEVQQAVCRVASDTFELTRSERGNLGVEFAKVAACNWNRTAIIESPEARLDYAAVLSGSLDICRKLSEQLDPSQTRIGVLPGNGKEATLLAISLAMCNRILVPLDEADPPGILALKIRKAGIKTIIASKIDKLDGLPVMPLAVSSLLPSEPAGPGKLLRLRARLLPGTLLPAGRAAPHSDCTIQFTRGTTGEPKPVRLSHHNILSNVEALREIIRKGESDVLIGSVPWSNIFGYTATTWLPILSGIPVVYTGKPFDAIETGRLCRQHRATILPTMPGFLAQCTELVDVDCLRTLRYVFTGGEALGLEVADAFRVKFGILPLEAYGATELSPVCSLSLPDLKIGRFSEKGTKRNASGRLLQGVAVRILEPGTDRVLPAGQTGIIHVKGPNVMSGYHNDPERTAIVLKNGWYNTGDFGYLDDTGFLTITGRWAD